MTTPIERHYNNTTTVGTLTAPATSGDLSFQVTGFAGFPALPFTITVDRNTVAEEICLVTATGSGTLTVTRGYNQTAATSHVAGATVEHTAIALDFQEANQHITASENIHGTSGELVGTEGAQTLLDKELVSGVHTADLVDGDAIVAQIPTGAEVRNLFRGVDSSGDDVIVVDSLGRVTTPRVYSTGTLEVDGASQLDGAVTVGATLTVTGTATAAAATAAAHLVRKSQLDSVGDRVTTLEAAVGTPTDVSTNSTIVKRDASGEASFDQVSLDDAAPTLAKHAVRKDYADARETAAKAYADSLVVDSGWQTVTVASGKQALASPPKVRKIGKVVYAQGGWNATGLADPNTNYVVGTIPNGYRPTVTLAFNPGMSAAGSLGRMSIDPDGSVNVQTSGSVATQWRLDTICWLVD